MREAERTTRQRITALLREEAATPSAISAQFDISPDTALTHVEHIAQTLESTDEQLLVSPPTCPDCGFDRFDDPLNRPSQCPACKYESVSDPAFRID